MSLSIHSKPARDSQTGAVTILVALTLLIFLSLVAVGMSRNSFREIVISGTTRQGAMAANAADAGIEWATYWLYPGNVAASTSKSATALGGANGLVTTLLQSPNTWGQYLPLTNYGSGTSPTYYTGPGKQTLASDMTIGTSNAGFTTALMLMGKLPITNSSQGVSASGFRPAVGSDVLSNAPDLWAVRSDGQVTSTGVIFRQSREAWISTPTR